MPEDTMHSMSRVVLHNLWRNHLCHANHDTTKDIYKHCEGVPNLKLHNSLFQCSGCTPNITKKVRGYNKHPIRAKKRGERFNHDFDLVRSTDCIGEEKVETS